MKQIVLNGGKKMFFLHRHFKMTLFNGYNHNNRGTMILLLQAIAPSKKKQSTTHFCPHPTESDRVGTEPGRHPMILLFLCSKPNRYQDSFRLKH